MGLFDKLKSFVNKLKTPREPFDPLQFDDPVAASTDWTPAKSGGANFRTHKLCETNFDRVEFRLTIGVILFCSLFLAVGLCDMFIPPIVSLAKHESLWKGQETLFLFLFGFVFASAGGGMLYFVLSPRVFDKRIGYFWKGRKSPDGVSNLDSIKHITQLDNIHAIQLISKYCFGNDSSYHSYELNLVLKDASRMNVIDHGKKDKIIEDATKLAEFLNVPLWDAT